MPDVQLFSYHSVITSWKNIKNEKINEKINTFLAPASFFTKHQTLEFYLGLSNDNRKTLLLSEDAVRSIHKELEIFTSSDIPMIKVQHNPYRNVESIFIDSPNAYNKINKEIKKDNKKFQAELKFREMKEKWETAQNMLSTEKYFFVAIDVESWERDHSCILEVGWSMFDSKNNLYMDRHFCANEYRHLKNGQFVADMKDRFSFGKTVWEDLQKISTEILKDLAAETVKGRVVLVGHDLQMDLKYLEHMKIDVENVIKPVARFDTAEMNAVRVGKPNERISLGKLLDELDIDNYCLHNAGNDAHYTLYLFLKLCKLQKVWD